MLLFSASLSPLSIQFNSIQFNSIQFNSIQNALLAGHISVCVAKAL
uniref:Uncharacterized protein n=1 Tax=Anguilla anguilla TaxID=7936 RepID=A0A0E9Q3R5_ANGAN